MPPVHKAEDDNTVKLLKSWPDGTDLSNYLTDEVGFPVTMMFKDRSLSGNNLFSQGFSYRTGSCLLPWESVSPM